VRRRRAGRRREETAAGVGRPGGRAARPRVQHHEAGLLGRHDEVVVGLGGLMVVVEAGEGVHARHAARQVVGGRQTERRSHGGEGGAVLVILKVGAGRVTEALGERVGLNLELGDALVLVGRDSGELGLREDKGPVLLLLNVGHGTVVSLAPLDEIHPRLELVHGVEDQLAGVVRLVVRDLHLLKADHLFPQLFSGEGTVRMRMQPVGGRRVRLARHQPGGAVVGVPVPLVVTRHNVQEHEVLDPRLVVQPRKAAAHRREHPPPRPRDNHLRAKLTELVPQLLVLQAALDAVQLWTVGLLDHPAAPLLLRQQNPLLCAAAVRCETESVLLLLNVVLLRLPLDEVQLVLDEGGGGLLLLLPVLQAGHDGGDGEVGRLGLLVVAFRGE